MAGGSYSLAHAFGAAFDNPDLVVACKFLNPATDGAVLPILHLNGYKIANPTVLARIPHEELDALLRGYGYAPRYVTGEDQWPGRTDRRQRRPTSDRTRPRGRCTCTACGARSPP